MKSLIQISKKHKNTCADDVLLGLFPQLFYGFSLLPALE